MPVKMRLSSYSMHSLMINPATDTWIVDHDYIYLLKEGFGFGLYKLSKGQEGKMPSQIVEHNEKLCKEESSMVLLNDKLYIRYKDLAPQPFVVVDKHTLKVEEMDPNLNFDPKEGDIHSLQWKGRDEENGRSLTYTPMITDGQYLYVISRQFLTKEQ